MLITYLTKNVNRIIEHIYKYFVIYQYAWFFSKNIGKNSEFQRCLRLAAKRRIGSKNESSRSIASATNAASNFWRIRFRRGYAEPESNRVLMNGYIHRRIGEETRQRTALGLSPTLREGVAPESIFRAKLSRTAPLR